MALDKQIVDIPTTAGVDTKTDSVNDSPPAMSDINNLRFTNTGAYNPRSSFSALQALTATSTDYVLEGRDAVLSSVDRYLYRTINGANTQLAPVWSPKARNFTMGGGQNLVGSGSSTTKTTSTTLTDNTFFYVWEVSTSGFGYQFMTDDGQFVTSGYQAFTNIRYLVATAGPAGAAFVWVTDGSNNLNCYRVTTTAVTAITIPSITSVSRFSITYSSTDSAWYAIYTIGSTTTLNKLTISGTTITSSTSVTAVSSSTVDVDVIRSTTYVVVAYWASTDITVKYYNTSLTLQFTQTRTPSVSSPSAYLGFGICETTTDVVFCSVTTHYNLSGSVLHAFRYTTSGAANVWDAAPVGFSSPTVPIYVNSRVYLYAADASMVGSQSAALIQIANYDGGTISQFQVCAQWAGDQATLTEIVGAYSNGHYQQKSRMCKTANTLSVPYHRLGTFLFTRTSTAGNASSVVSSLVQADYTSANALAAAIHFSLTETTTSASFNIGTSSIVTSTNALAIDGAGQGPSSPWPCPNPYNKELATGGLLADGLYTYVFVKVWSDSLGNRQTLESLPLRFDVDTVGGTPYNLPKFTFASSAFSVYNTVSSGQSSAVIEVYRTEVNGTIPYFLDTITASTSMPYQDTDADANLVRELPLPSSSGELTNTVVSGSRAATLWKGRLAILPIDSDTKIYYSKPAEDFRFPAYASGLEIDVPQTSSPLTALGTMDGVLYAFTNNQVYTVYGDPAGNTGEGSSLTIPEIRFNGVGCEDPASVLLAPPGLFFKSAKGFYSILRNQELNFIGEGPFSDRDEKVVGAWANEGTSEVAFALDSGNVWVYDWQAKAWSRWTPPIGTGDTITGASLINGLPTYITQEGIYQEVTTNTETFATSVTTAWIRLGALQGYQRVYNMWLYLERLTDHTLTIDMYLDGKETSVYTWTIDSTTLATTVPEQIRLSVPVQKCSAIKLKISSTNAGWILKGIAAEIGIKPTAYKSRSAPNNY